MLTNYYRSKYDNCTKHTQTYLDFRVLLDFQNNKNLMKINDINIHIMARHLKHSGKEEKCVIMQIDPNDFHKIKHKLIEHYSKLHDLLDEDVYLEVIDHFVKHFNHIYALIWKKPFLEECGAFEVVLGTQINGEHNQSSGIFDIWMKIDKTVILNKEIKIVPPILSPLSDVDIETLTKIYFDLFRIVSNEYADILETLASQLNYD